LKRNIIEKSGAWYSYGGNKDRSGQENVKEFLKGNPSVASEIQDKIIEGI